MLFQNENLLAIMILYMDGMDSILFLIRLKEMFKISKSMISKIKFKDYNFTDDKLKFLSLLPEIEYLDLSQSDDITNLGLKEIRSLKQLKYLDIRNCTKITERGIWNLGPCSELRYLSIGYFHMKEVGLWAISNFTNLTTLIINDINMFSFKSKLIREWIDNLSNLELFRNK